MGVLGLWNLVEESGTRVNIETLEGKVLAVDLSIWINQAIKGFRDKDGKALENAHILGLFHRICKLLYYGVKPIFVFDGESPLLKSRTAAKRREKTIKSLDKAKNMSLSILEKYALSQYSQDPNKAPKATSSQSKSPKKPNDIYEEFVDMLKNFENKIDDSDVSDEDLDDSIHSACYFPMGDSQNIRNVDIKSESFLSLPAVARYEVLQEMRESYKGRKNPFPEKLPTDSEEFSSFQMGKLLKKRNLQEEIDKVIDELNSHDDDEEDKEWAKRLDFDMKTMEKMFRGKLASDEKTKFLFLKKIISKKMKNTSTDVVDEVSGDDSNMETSAVDDKDQELSFESLMAFELPNKLLDQGETLTDSQRIEHLSQLKGSQKKPEVGKFNSAKLMGQLEQNINKIHPSASGSQESKSTIKLSDDEQSSEDDDADLVDVEEYNMQVVKQQLPETTKTLFEELVLPYNTDYSLTIEVPISQQNNNEKVSEKLSKIEQKQLDLEPCSSRSVFQPESTALSESPEIKEAGFIVIDLEKSQPPESIFKISKEIKKIDHNETDTRFQAVDEQKEKSGIELVSPKKSLPKEDTVRVEKSPEKAVEKTPEPKQPKASVPPEPVDVEKLIEDSKRANTIARQAMSVSQQMLDDCQKLLMLFGCPFLISPAEAEAQCATLEQLGLCEGVITDDSDIFLFGGQIVYKNFFSNDKFITQFRADDLERFYGLNRSKLICLGMMCGTDYTVGIDGIGPVNGLEILGEFPGEGLKPLEEYADWYRKRKSMKNTPPENKIRSKLLRFKLPPSFPSRVVYEAYYNANTDQSTAAFSWSMPQLYQLRLYASHNFGWSVPKADALLLPVVKNFNKKQTQKRIEMYFPTVSKSSVVTEKLKINRSKRLNAAIHQSIAISQKASPTKGSKAPKKRRQSQLDLSEESSSSED